MFVDFKLVKEKVPIAEVLRRWYGLVEGMRPKGTQLVGRCPFKEGKSESFTVQRERGVWCCFSCKRGGDVLDFVALRERITLQKVGELLAGWFDIPANREESEPVEVNSDRNEPLRFELKKLDPRHPLLNELGIAATTLEAFGAGYANAGLLKGLLAIAVRDVTGMLVAYVGLALDTGEYLFPKNFRPELEVFRLHELLSGELLEGTCELRIAADPLGAIRLSERASEPVVGLFSSKLSQTPDRARLRAP